MRNVSNDRQNSVIHFLTSRWRGDVPLRTIFLRDMLIFGTIVNVVTALSALLLFASDAPDGVAVTVFFSSLPYNVFLFVAVWKSAMNTIDPLRVFARLGAPLWLILTIVI